MVSQARHEVGAVSGLAGAFFRSREAALDFARSLATYVWMSCPAEDCEARER